MLIVASRKPLMTTSKLDWGNGNVQYITVVFHPMFGSFWLWFIVISQDLQVGEVVRWRRRLERRNIPNVKYEQIDTSKYKRFNYTKCNI